MTAESTTSEIAAYMERAEQSIQAARQLASSGYYDFAASRAYYAAFYAATALLLSEGVELSKHSAVIASIHQRFVKTGRLDKEHGKTLNWLFELRSIGDYGGVAHVSSQEAEQAIVAAERFAECRLWPQDKAESAGATNNSCPTVQGLTGGASLCLENWKAFTASLCLLLPLPIDAIIKVHSGVV